MKKGNRVVNIGRGKYVDEDTLADTLEASHIKSVSLEVFQ